MYAIYLKENLKLITFLSDLESPNNAEYKKPIYSYVQIEDKIAIEFYEKQNQGKEIIVKDGKLQEMIYTEELVKFLKDQEDFKKDTYAKIEKYDFRLEGINYIKTAEDDPQYLAYLKQQEFEKAKKEKIKLTQELFKALKIEIIDVADNSVVDTFEPSRSIVKSFEEGIEFEETPFEFFTFSNPNKSIFLPNASLQILVTEVKGALQYRTTNILRNEREIEALKTTEEINSYTIKAGANLDKDVADKIKIIVKIANKETLITRVAKVQTLGDRELELTNKNY